MSKIIAAVFPSKISADMATEQMKDKNISTDDISIIRLCDTEHEYKTFYDKLSQNPGYAPTSSFLGALGTFGIPGVGMLTAYGTAMGLVTGDEDGGISGMLSKLDASDKNTSEYEEIIRQRRVYFSKPIDNKTGGKISKILKKHGAENITIHKNK